MISTSGHCFEKELIMLNVRWYLGYKDLREMADEREVDICHTMIIRWVHNLSPQVEAKALKTLKPVPTN